MAVKDTLDKIVERHPFVIGAMVMHDGKVQHNLDAPYDILAVDTILETFTEIIEQTSILEDEGYDFSELMVDFANHSFIVRSIDNGLLAVLSPQMQRGQLVKLHVGLGIFGKAVQKAIEDESAASVQPSGPEMPEEAKTSPVILHDGMVVQPVSEHVEPETEDTPSDESSLAMMMGFAKKRLNGFRGTRELIASRVAEAEEAISEPTPKEAVSNADGIPLRSDGTPMKKRVYRGAVFWE